MENEKEMNPVNFNAINTLWRREVIRFFRLKSRIIGSLGLPIFFLIFLSMGFRGSFSFSNVSYIDFLTPGIIGMIMLFASSFAGLSVLWDKEFGFLREIMVAPVSRLSIVLGRTAGNTTTALIQGILILVLGIPLGFKINGIVGFALSIIFMILIGVTFIGLGLVFASKMKDMHGFSLIMNFIIFPIFLLSGAIFPISKFPGFVRILAYLDPLTYGVDGLRACLIGISDFPIYLDFFALLASCIIMLGLGAYFFERTEVG